jgi:hypothetical protein
MQKEGPAQLLTIDGRQARAGGRRQQDASAAKTEVPVASTGVRAGGNQDGVTVL